MLVQVNEVSERKNPGASEPTQPYDEAVQLIQGIQDPSTQERCLQALEESMGQPACSTTRVSAEDLSRRHGLAKEILLDHKVVLCKADIVVYLRRFGLNLSLAYVRKQLSSVELKTCFGPDYEPVYVRRNLCLSFSETREFFLHSRY